MLDPTLVSAARRSTREEFAGAFSWPFLVGEPELQVPRTAMKTMVMAPALRHQDTLHPDGLDAPTTETSDTLVLPIRKRQSLFPEMITLGRTSNNDLVINDATVSKFHAFFRSVEERWELADVGSRNGTKVMGRALVTRQPVVLTPGTRVRFGTVNLVFCTAREAWDALRGI